MVEPLIAAAALAAAASNPAEALGAPAAGGLQPASPEHTRSAVPVERRRIARATPARGADLESIRPLIRRARADTGLVEARALLEKAEHQMGLGNREQAMLTLDGASLQLERLRPDMKGNTSFIETFHELQLRESSLREKLGEPVLVPLRPAPKKTDVAPAEPGDGAPPAAAPGEGDDEVPVTPSTRDELPVG